MFLFQPDVLFKFFKTSEHIKKIQLNKHKYNVCIKTIFSEIKLGNDSKFGYFPTPSPSTQILCKMSPLLTFIVFAKT